MKRSLLGISILLALPILFSGSIEAAEPEPAYRFDRSPDALVLDYYILSTWLLPIEPMRRIQIYGDGRVLAHVRTGDLAGTHESHIDEQELQELLSYLEANQLMSASKASLERGMKEAGHRGTLTDGGIYHLRLFLDGTPSEPHRKIRTDIRMENLPHWAKKYPEVEELQGVARCLDRLMKHLEAVARKRAKPSRKER